MLSPLMEWREKQLLESVKSLAAPPDEQVAYLRQLGTFPSVDELALEFDNMFDAAGTDPLGGAREWQEAVRRLDLILRRMSGPENAHLWVVEALDGPEWAEVRGAARHALKSRPQ